jgi:hypothetical protein
MGIFHSSPLFWLKLYRTGKPCFVYFDISGTFPNSIWPEIFWALIFYHGNLLENEKSMRWATRLKRALVAQAPS